MLHLTGILSHTSTLTHCGTSFRALTYAALAGGMLLATSCKKNNEMAAAPTTANDIISAQNAGLGDEESATTADMLDAAAPRMPPHRAVPPWPVPPT